MHKLTKQVLTGVIALGLLAPVATQAISNNPQTTVNAKRRRHAKRLNAEGGQTVRLTKPTKVHFIRMYSEPWKNHQIHAKTLRRGTVLHAFGKDTEGVAWCAYGKHAHITRKVWPSVWLNKHNCKVLHHYGYRYSYMYTMKHVLHYHE